MKKECTVHGYSGFSLAVDEAGKVYLKTGKHPLAQKDTPIGIIGRPYSTHPLLQPQIQERFMGHTPGADPMSHAQTYRANLRKTGDDPNPDRHDEYRCALWCEIPHEAYTALMDALFRPYITTQEIRMNRTDQVLLHIHTPYLRETSQLHIQGSAKGTYWTSHGIMQNRTPIKIDIDPAKPEYQAAPAELRTGPNHHTLRFTNVHSLQCSIKVRLDLFGDHKICLPCEPLFCGLDISTNAEGRRWIEFDKTFVNDANYWPTKDNVYPPGPDGGPLIA